MKKILLSLLILAACAVSQAQTTPPRSTYAIPGINAVTQTQLNVTQPYMKRVTAVTQSSTTAPVDTAVESNFPHTPTWRYVSAGLYNYRCAGCFGSAAKKYGVFPSLTVPGNTMIRSLWLSSDSVSVTTTDTSGTVTNGKMTNLMLEFRAYP
jgi:hypothetical protein